MGLQDHIKGVTAEAAPESPPVDPEVPEIPEGEGTGTEDRSSENIRGELLRKQDKGFRAIDDRINLLADQVTNLASSLVQNQTSAPAKTASRDSFDDYSLTELENLRPTVMRDNPDQIAAFDYELLKRRQDESINSRLTEMNQEMRATTDRQQYAEQAADRYPDLRNRSSDFYREVDVLVKQEEKAGSTNPRLVLNAANEVFASKPALYAPRTVEGIHKTGGTRTTPVEPNKKGGVRSDESRQEIADALRGALPDPDKGFNMDNVKKSEEYYADHREDHIRQ